MLLASIAIGVVIVALLWDLVLPSLKEAYERHRARRALIPGSAYDPGRERRAEQRARQLLQSCVNEEEWSMYRDLGFIRVWGGMARVPRRARMGDDPRAGAPYAYLVYPHKPIVAYLPQTRELLNEYCVEFPDETRPYGSSRLPDSDDVLAKWMAPHRRRAAPHRHRQHAPARPPGRPQAGPPRPLAPEPVGARAPAPHAALARRRRHALGARPPRCRRLPAAAPRSAAAWPPRSPR